jgi:hypothetical protein
MSCKRFEKQPNNTTGGAPIIMGARTHFMGARTH